MIELAFGELISALLFTFFSTSWVFLTYHMYDQFIYIITNDYELLINPLTFGVKNIIVFSWHIFIAIFMVLVCTVFITKTIKCFILFAHYTFFYTPSNEYKQMNIFIDENNIIQDNSYVELKNGSSIPLNIKRIQFKVDNLKKESNDEQS